MGDFVRTHFYEEGISIIEGLRKRGRMDRRHNHLWAEYLTVRLRTWSYTIPCILYILHYPISFLLIELRMVREKTLAAPNYA